MAKAMVGDLALAESTSPVLLEGSFYFPPSSVRKDLLTVGDRQYTCPWKGKATYWDIRVGESVLRNAAWSYDDPKDAARQITGHVAFDKSAVSVTS